MEVTTDSGVDSVGDIQRKEALDQEMLSALYANLLDHKFGVRILEDLQKKFPVDQNVFSETEGYDTHAAAFRDGARTPVLYILKQIQDYERRK